MSLLVRLGGAEEGLVQSWVKEQHCAVRCKHKCFLISFIIYTCLSQSVFPKRPQVSCSCTISGKISSLSSYEETGPSKGMWGTFQALVQESEVNTTITFQKFWWEQCWKPCLHHRAFSHISLPTYYASCAPLTQHPAKKEELQQQQ